MSDRSSAEIRRHERIQPLIEVEDRRARRVRRVPRRRLEAFAAGGRADPAIQAHEGGHAGLAHAEEQRRARAEAVADDADSASIDIGPHRHPGQHEGQVERLLGSPRAHFPLIGERSRNAHRRGRRGDDEAVAGERFAKGRLVVQRLSVALRNQHQRKPAGGGRRVGGRHHRCVEPGRDGRGRRPMRREEAGELVELAPRRLGGGQRVLRGRCEQEVGPVREGPGAGAAGRIPDPDVDRPRRARGQRTGRVRCDEVGEPHRPFRRGAVRGLGLEGGAQAGDQNGKQQRGSPAR